MSRILVTLQLEHDFIDLEDLYKDSFCFISASDSFYELEHSLGEYPGIVVVRAKMEFNGTTFYADGIGMLF
jgi:hypothetical protein